MKAHLLYHWLDSSSHCRSSRELSYQELGIAKLSVFREWLSLHSICTESEHGGNLEIDLISQKMIIFAHHLKVLDGVQAFVCEKGVGFIRIDGNTLARDRQAAVQAFRASAEIKIAIIGITAGGVGIDFSSAQNVVFLELPQSVSEMLQAEDRAHRRGQTNAVNIYIFCAKDTSDDTRWLNLNKSLRRVSSVMNGKYDAVQEIEVDRVSDLALEENNSIYGNLDTGEIDTPKIEASGTISVDETANTTRENGLSESTPNKLYEVQTISENRSVILGMQPAKTRGEIPGEDVIDRKIEMIQNDLVSYEDSRASDVIMAENIILNEKAPTSETLRIGSPERFHTNKSNEDANQMLKLISSDGISLPSAVTNINEDALQSSKVQLGKSFSVASNGDNCGPFELLNDKGSYLIPASSLQFEVSQYTGRVHLYTCVPGKDLRPRPLFENFHPEELEPLDNSSLNASKKTGEFVVKENPAFKHCLVTFIKEWNDLRPIEQKKLLGKPLKLPLSLELYYLKESMNHGSGGLLKGGSKRRVTPLDQISYPLPENAAWKIISLCSGYGKKEKKYAQGWTVSGEPLCKLCQTPCKSKLSKTPEYFEDLFCNLACLKEYRTRTSQRFLREELFKIEHGICRLCNLDCHKLIKCIRPLSLSSRQKYIETVAPMLANHKKIFDKLVKEPIEGNAWHADHIVAVHRGGGECSLDNMRTLCVVCHKEVTATQRTEQRLTRRKAKERLNGILLNLKNGAKAEEASSQDRANLEMGANEADEGLLFRVPGSAYTNGKDILTESEQKGSVDEDKLLNKVPGGTYTECKSRFIETELESSSNEDELLCKVHDIVYTEGKSSAIEIERKVNEDELLPKVPVSAETEGANTYVASEQGSSSIEEGVVFKVPSCACSEVESEVTKSERKSSEEKKGFKLPSLEFFKGAC